MIFLLLIIIWWHFMVELGGDDVVYDGDASGEASVAKPLRS